MGLPQFFFIAFCFGIRIGHADTSADAHKPHICWIYAHMSDLRIFSNYMANPIWNQFICSSKNRIVVQDFFAANHSRTLLKSIFIIQDSQQHRLIQCVFQNKELYSFLMT